MNTQADKKKRNSVSLVRRISRTYSTAMLLIYAVILFAFCYINLKNLYGNTLVDMANRVSMQFRDSMNSQYIEEAFRDSRTNYFSQQLDDLNKYSRPENVRLYVVFPNGVTSLYDQETERVTFTLLPPQFFGVFNKTIVSHTVCSEYPSFKNSFQNWIVSVPIYSQNDFTGGMVITSICMEDVFHQLLPTFITVAICIILAMFLLLKAQQSFSVILQEPLENITTALENWSINSIEKKSPDIPDEIGRLSQALVEVADRLEKEKLSRDKDEENRRNFFFHVSHELRTPIASLRAQAELLKDGLASEEELPQYYNGILQEVRHLQDMVEDLLTLSRLQAPGYTMETEVCCMSEILNDVYPGMEKVASAQGIRLNMDQQLSPEQTLVLGNYTRIRQMILIFLENAVKYSERQSRIDILLEQKGKDLVLSICDQGCGIPADEQESVFRYQYRASNAASQSGNGLGLPIAREIAQLLHFRIILESKENIGTTVRVIMPRTDG